MSRLGGARSAAGGASSPAAAHAEEEVGCGGETGAGEEGERVNGYGYGLIYLP